MFHRQPKSTLSSKAKSLEHLQRHVRPAQLLADPKRQALMKSMKQLTQLEDSRYDSLCTVLVDSLVDYCQSLPETSNSYYAQPGGLVDHALNRTEAALSLFQDYLVYDETESISDVQKQWQYALYSAALLQGIGKLFVDFRIHLYEGGGHVLKQWNPLLHSLNSIGSFYDYEFQKESDVEFRRRLNLLLARALIPTSGFVWIASNDELLALWLALLNEDSRSAGTLGAILIRADAIAIQRYIMDHMGGKLALNARNRYAGGGTFSGGSAAALLQKEQAIGIEFLQWLVQSLESGKLMINKAPLFMVPGGLLMCQEAFEMFSRHLRQEQAQGQVSYKDWQVQKGFLSLGLHEPGLENSARSRFEDPQSKQMQEGVLVKDYAVVLPNSVQILNSKGAVQKVSALDLLNGSYDSVLLPQKAAQAQAGLQKFAWQNEDPAPSLGVHKSV